MVKPHTIGWSLGSAAASSDNIGEVTLPPNTQEIEQSAVCDQSNQSNIVPSGVISDPKTKLREIRLRRNR